MPRKSHVTTKELSKPGRSHLQVRSVKDPQEIRIMIDELIKILPTRTTLCELYTTLLTGIHEIMGFSRSIFFEIDKKNFCLSPAACYGLDKDFYQQFTIPLGFEGGEITDTIFLQKHFIITEPLDEQDVFKKRLQSNTYVVFPVTYHIANLSSAENGSQENSGIPITENERRKLLIASKDMKDQGVLWMDKNGVEIASDDISNLDKILQSAAIVIDNMKMRDENMKMFNELTFTHEQLKIAKARIDKDLEHARDVQRVLLPANATLPNTHVLKVSAAYTPADLIGGDYYDIFEINKGIYGVVIADVSGHGVSSALLMSMIKVLLKIIAPQTLSAQKTLEKINEIYVREVKTFSHFITIFYSIIDTNKNQFRFSSAGHCPFIFLNKKDGSCTAKKPDGILLGMFEDLMLHEECLSYNPGDQRVILYTDGLIEARNPHDEMYDLPRLKEVGQKTLSFSHTDACLEIIAHQKKFCDTNTAPNDDITLMILDF